MRTALLICSLCPAQDPPPGQTTMAAPRKGGACWGLAVGASRGAGCSLGSDPLPPGLLHRGHVGTAGPSGSRAEGGEHLVLPGTS